MKRILQIIGKGFLVLILLLFIVGVLFVNLSPQFGGKPTASEIEDYEQLDYYEDGVFNNLIPTSMDIGFKKTIELIGEFWTGAPNLVPSKVLPQLSVDSLDLVRTLSIDKIIWFGHSAVLLQLNGKNILLDPMLGEVPAPHPLLGGKRFNNELPIEIEELPQIDFILISHDHYDHLDYESILKLKEKTNHFLVPAGVAAHIRSWEIDASKIHEFYWWEELVFEDFKFAFAPTRHFSGRGFTERTTLWGSWIIKSENRNIYFSGDGGYGPHFKKIGEKYGPFDFAMLECGQYNDNWEQIHLMPEQTAQAGVDVRAKVMMPIHWGAFALSLHAWNDPVKRVKTKAEELQIPLISPIIGELVTLDNINVQDNAWWIHP